MNNLRVSIIVLAIIISWINNLNSEPVKGNLYNNPSLNSTSKHDNGQEVEQEVDKLGQRGTQNVLGQETSDKGTLNLTASRRKRYIELAYDDQSPELQGEMTLLNGERHRLRKQKPAQGRPEISDVFKEVWEKKTKKPRFAKTPKLHSEDPEKIDVDEPNNLRIFRKQLGVVWKVVKNIFKKESKPKKTTKPSKTKKTPTKKPSESHTPEIPLIVEINVYPEIHFNIDGNSDRNNIEIVSAIETILSHSACGRLLNKIGGKKIILN